MKNTSVFGKQAEEYLRNTLGAIDTPCGDALKIPSIPLTYVYFENSKAPGRLSVQFNWKRIGTVTTLTELQDKLNHAKVLYKQLVDTRATLKTAGKTPALANVLLGYTTPTSPRRATRRKQVPEFGTPDMVAEGFRLGITNADKLTYWRLFHANRVADPSFGYENEYRKEKLIQYGAECPRLGVGVSQPLSQSKLPDAVVQQPTLDTSVLSPVEKTIWNTLLAKIRK